MYDPQPEPPADLMARSADALHTIPRQIAVRYAAGEADAVRARLARFGTIEDQPAARMLIIEYGRETARATIERLLQALCDERLVEFWTPVLRDAKSGTRKLLTDEIVLRFKSAGTSKQALAEMEARHGITVCRRNEFEPSQYIVRVPKASGTQTIDIARTLDKRADVEFAAPNFLTGVKR